MNTVELSKLYDKMRQVAKEEATKAMKTAMEEHTKENQYWGYLMAGTFISIQIATLLLVLLK